MRPIPDISVIVSTHERPGHLERCLLSLACQQGVAGGFEVIVADDGSRDGTEAMVEGLAAHVPYALHFVTQPHQGFRLSRCRNNGARIARASYLLFTDGDCVLPPDHLAIHLRMRQRRWSLSGDAHRFDQTTSERIDEQAIRTAAYLDWVSPRDRRRYWFRGLKDRFNTLRRHPRRPKLIGNNIAVWRSDFEAINGFDERFVGWGGEDDDFAGRLRASGVRIGSVVGRTMTYHLWHPPASTQPHDWKGGLNVAYLHRAGRVTRCVQGMHPRLASDLRVEVANIASASQPGRPEVEVVAYPAADRFTTRAECRILVVGPHSRAPRRLERQAHLVLHSPQPAHMPEVLAAVRRDLVELV